MMRACHLNTCPVIATQDPELRKRFKGEPEHVVEFFFHVAEEAREIMRRIGVKGMASTDRTRRPAPGRRRDRALEGARGRPHARAGDAGGARGTPLRRVRPQDSPAPGALDWRLIEKAKDAIDHRKPVSGEFAIRNVNRTVGGLLSSAVTEVHGAEGLPPRTIRFALAASRGSRSAHGWRRAWS